MLDLVTVAMRRHACRLVTDKPIERHGRSGCPDGRLCLGLWLGKPQSVQSTTGLRLVNPSLKEVEENGGRGATPVRLRDFTERQSASLSDARGDEQGDTELEDPMELSLKLIEQWCWPSPWGLKERHSTTAYQISEPWQ